MFESQLVHAMQHAPCAAVVVANKEWLCGMRWGPSEKTGAVASRRALVLLEESQHELAHISAHSTTTDTDLTTWEWLQPILKSQKLPIPPHRNPKMRQQTVSQATSQK